MKRVVITGMGPVSAIGMGREAFFAALREGRTGIGEITAFDTAGYRSTRAALVADFNVADYLESQKNYLDHASELAYAAMSLALEDADLDAKTMAGASAGLMLGSAFGNLATMSLFFGDYLQKGPRLVKPVLFPHTYSNTTISLLAMDYNLSGYQVNYSAGSVSSGCAIAAGYDLIRLGRASLVFAGGFEGFCEPLFAGCDRSGAGFTLGEGAGILVLEEVEHARARGARILGELVGAGLTGGLRIADAMRLALASAPFAEKELDLILSAANGSPDLDGKESAAIEALLAGSAGVAVRSIKPLIGETLGAGAALQVMAALGEVRGVPREVRNGLVNAIDPGGSVVSLAVQRSPA